MGDLDNECPPTDNEHTPQSKMDGPITRQSINDLIQLFHLYLLI